MPSNVDEPDMPQPLSRVNPNARCSFGVGQLSTYPHLATLAMETIAAIAQAENSMGKILATMLGSEPDKGLAMFNALTSSVAQMAALKTVAANSLSEKDNTILEKIHNQTKAAFKRRHEFAHHVWGVSDELPNALLLVDSKHFYDKKRKTFQPKLGFF